MGYLEIRFYEKCKSELGVNSGKYIEENSHRFLDDCYIALDATNLNPLKFFDLLNNIHDHIKFAMEQQKLYLPFLDIMVNKDPETNNISMEMFYKKLIPGDVFHLTFSTLNNVKAIYLLHSLEEELIPFGKQPSEKKGFGRTSKSFIFPRISTKFNSTFNSCNKNVFPLIKAAFQSLQQSYETKECFKDIKLIKSQRKPSSLV